MRSLQVRESDTDPPVTVNIKNGDVTTSKDGPVADLVKPYSGMDMLTGAEPPAEDATPAEKFLPATDAEIQQQLIGVLRNNGYGVVVP